MIWNIEGLLITVSRVSKEIKRKLKLYNMYNYLVYLSNEILLK